MPVPTALNRLVDDPDSFLRTSFGRAPVHVTGADAGAFTDLLSLDDVDDIVASSGVRAPSFRLVKDGDTLPQDHVTRTARIGSRPVHDLIDVGAVQRGFADGATIVLQGLHRTWAPIAAFCRSLEATLTHPVQANAYLTPPVAQGLHLHADPHDVFALQTHGAKRWVVHADADGDPWDLELRPGDVLYLPAGTRHAAQTIDLPSLHLTIGVRTTTWRELVRRAIDASLDDASLDTPLPAGWAAQPDGLRDELTMHLKEVGGGLNATTSATVTGVLRDRARAFWGNRPVDRTGGLRDLLDIDDLDDATRLAPRTDLGRDVIVDGDRLRIVVGDRELRMPGELRPVIDRIRSLDAFAPKELDALIDEPSRLVLCRWLVREGVLTIERPSRDPG